MAVPDCPALHSSVDEESLIKQYFDRGYTYKDIRAFLEAKHGIVLSEDQLRGLLKRLGLKRRGSESSLEEVEAAIRVSKNKDLTRPKNRTITAQMCSDKAKVCSGKM